MLIQSQRPTIRPITTAHLAQTMTLMGLTAAELRQRIEAELASNPALELVGERRCQTCHRPLATDGPCPVCNHPPISLSQEPIVFVSPREDFHLPRTSGLGEEMPAEEFTPEEDDLATFVLRQIAPDLAPEDRPIAAHILTSLDEDGLLSISLLEIARYHHVLPSRVQQVQHMIQRADPVGVGSASPQEALLVQLDALAETVAIPKFAYRAIQEGMELLSRHAYLELGRKLGISTTQAREIARFISDNLYPFPARAHWGDIHNNPAELADNFQTPDVVISRLSNDTNTPLIVEVISPMAGKLRIDPLFRQALQDAPPEKTEEWQAVIEQASLLVKCIQQRDHTIVRLMEKLAVLQRKFILFGDVHLKPITRASLATELEVHESTISRAVSSKAVQLPSGRIVPLAKLFDRSLPIRTVLRNIIAEEDKPLTDTQLVKLLKQKGYKVARRTVAKYRAMEGILPAHLRKMPLQAQAQ